LKTSLTTENREKQEFYSFNEFPAATTIDREVKVPFCACAIRAQRNRRHRLQIC